MDPQDPSSWRLPGPGEPATDEVSASGRARASSRDRGLRQVRRLSNWTAVALIAATAATAGYFAHSGSQQSAAVTVSHSPAQGSSAGQPCVSTPVAVSGGSGVKTTVPVPAQSCAPGTNGTRPTVIYVNSGEGRGD